VKQDNCWKTPIYHPHLPCSNLRTKILIFLHKIMLTSKTKLMTPPPPCPALPCFRVTSTKQLIWKKTGWPDWANFRQLGDRLLLSSPKFLYYCYLTVKVMYWFWFWFCIGLHFGRFFHKLIWSPCLQSTSTFSTIWQFKSLDSTNMLFSLDYEHGYRNSVKCIFS
jgi:hypothetical protein